MNKKTIATFLVLSVLTLGLVSPAFAQSQQPSGNHGFFGMFTQFFAKMFHPGQQGEGQNAPQGDQNAPSGMPNEEVHVTPGQVQGGTQMMINSKILTQAQQQEVTAEAAKIKAEMQAWSTSTGINALYLYMALRPFPMMGVGSNANNQQGQGEVHHGYMQGGSVQNGQGNPGDSHQGQLPSGQGIMAPRGVSQQ